MNTTPPAIDAVADNLRTDIPGSTVVVEHEGGIRWKVTATTDRVQMWVAYETRSRGRLLWKNSHLYIDGEPFPRARTYEALVDLFRTHGIGADSEDTTPVMVPVDQAPGPVQAMHRKIVVAPGFTLTVQRSGREWWVVLAGARGELRVVFVQPMMHPSRPLRDQPVHLAEGSAAFRLFIDGEDKSHLTEGMFSKALSVFTEAHAAAPAPAAVRGVADVATRATGVMVRNTTVIRN